MYKKKKKKDLEDNLERKKKRSKNTFFPFNQKKIFKGVILWRSLEKWKK